MEKLESHILVYDKKSNKSFSYSRHAQNYEHFLLPFPSFSNQSCLLIQLFFFFFFFFFLTSRQVLTSMIETRNSQLSNSSCEQSSLTHPYYYLDVYGHKYHLKVVESKYLQKGKTSKDHSQNHEQFKLKFMSHTIYPY